MRVCMISPHLPPEQAANALLPRQLGDELPSHGVITTLRDASSGGVRSTSARRRGVRPSSRPGPIRSDRSGCARRRRPHGHGRTGRRPRVRSRAPARQRVHHRSGSVSRAAVRKPYVITLYGTDVWHHDEARHARFGRVVRDAAERVFYSQGLLDFAKPLGLAPDPSSVIYAPVPSTFHALEPLRRDALRRDFGVGDAPLLLTVKRLHDVAGYDVLLRALPEILREHPGARAWIIGEGELRPALEAQARELGNRLAGPVPGPARQRDAVALLRGRGSLRAAVAARILGHRHARSAGVRHARGRDRHRWRGRGPRAFSGRCDGGGEGGPPRAG